MEAVAGNLEEPKLLTPGIFLQPEDQELSSLFEMLIENLKLFFSV